MIQLEFISNFELYEDTIKMLQIIQ